MTAPASMLPAPFRLAVLVVLLSVAAARPAVASETALGILGDPLRVWVDTRLQTLTHRLEPGIPEFDIAPAFQPQYTGTYDTTLRFTVGQTTVVSGNHQSGAYGFTPVDHKQDASDIVTTVSTDDGRIEIVHTLTYLTGDGWLRHTWVVKNSGNQTYTNVALRYGGDTNLANLESASVQGAYDETTAFLYCFNEDAGASGVMGMQAALASPADAYYHGPRQDVLDAMISAPDLPKSVVPGFNDNGMAMEWQGGTLHPGDSFTVSLYERWTDSAGSAVQVLTPAPDTVEAGTGTVTAFSVHNLLGSVRESQGGEVDLEVELAVPGEWSYELTIVSLTVAANSVGSVPVAVDVPAGTSPGPYEIVLTVRDPERGYQQSGTWVLTVLEGTEPPPPESPVVTLPNSSSLPLSSATVTVYTAISPSTSQGIDSVLAALSGQPSFVTRAFAWHTDEGHYLEIPAQADQLPDGMVVETGIFIATRRRLNYDLSGSPFDATYSGHYQFPVPPGTDAVGIPTGWTFAGLPPIKLDTDFTQSQYYYWPGMEEPPSDATPLELLVNGEPASDADLILVMGDGDVETGSIDSSRPWAWNAGANRYEQTALLRVGQAYWFKNNSTVDEVTIQVSASQRQVVTLRSATATRSTTSTTTTVQRTNLRDRGTPPPMPGASGATAGGSAKSSSSGGCGSGSGLGLFGLLMFIAGLRLLVVRR